MVGHQIGDEAKIRLADWVRTVDPKLIGELSASQQGKLVGLRLLTSSAETVLQTSEPANSWLAWAQQLKRETFRAQRGRSKVLSLTGRLHRL